MRRLDTFTIIIIAVCLIAAALLIYIGWNKIAGDNATDDKSALYEEIENDEDGEFYYLDDEETNTTDSNIDADADGTPEDFNTTTTNTAQNTSTLEEEDNYEIVDKNGDPEEETARPNNYSTQGSYLVLAGSFKIEANAETHARNIRSKGYTNTNVERFDKGTYAVVLVDRFNGFSDAAALVKRLKSDGVDAYVKKK